MHPIEITTQKATVLVVQVPEDLISYTTRTYAMHKGLMAIIYNTPPRVEFDKEIILPRGQWQILSLLKDITEEQARSIVERFYDFDGIPGFYNYPDKKTVWSKATESLHSLLTSHGVDTKQNQILLIKEK